MELAEELELIESFIDEVVNEDEEPLVLNIPNNYCLACGLNAENGYKYIYAVCMYSSKRCVKPHTTIYYLREEDTRIFHDEHESIRISVIRVDPSDASYMTALENSFMMQTGKLLDCDYDEFIEWRKKYVVDI